MRSSQLLDHSMNISRHFS